MRARRAFGGSLAIVALVACAGDAAKPAPSIEDRYLDPSERAFRRSELVASLVNPSNGYSQLRLAHYATGDVDDWERLPEWNPAVEAIVDEGAIAAPLGPDARALDLDAQAEELGLEAFFRYPMQLVYPAPKDPTGYGFWTDATRGLGGLVRFRLADGSTGVALTCSSCHAMPDERGVLDVGRPNARLDLGRLFHDQDAAPETFLQWGPGRVDVTTFEGTEPVRMGDLRAVRWESHLQADATVAQRDVVSLAIRIETLMLTTRDEELRPPRVVALALAKLLWSMADRAPSPGVPTDANANGRAIFESTCATCHVPPSFAGVPVALDVVGTDPTIGRSADRGTGAYRVPSLHFVGTRGPLLHDASVPDLETLFDPTRLDPTFTGGTRGAGAIAGHEWGLELSPADRADLVAFLRAL